MAHRSSAFPPGRSVQFIYRVSSLWLELGVSSVIVVGGCGDYFDVHNTAILVDNYAVFDATERAHSVSEYAHLRLFGIRYITVLKSGAADFVLVCHFRLPHQVYFFRTNGLLPLRLFVVFLLLPSRPATVGISKSYIRSPGDFASGVFSTRGEGSFIAFPGQTLPLRELSSPNRYSGRREKPCRLPRRKESEIVMATTLEALPLVVPRLLPMVARLVAATVGRPRSPLQRVAMAATGLAETRSVRQGRCRRRRSSSSSSSSSSREEQESRRPTGKMLHSKQQSDATALVSAAAVGLTAPPPPPVEPSAKREACRPTFPEWSSSLAGQQWSGGAPLACDSWQRRRSDPPACLSRTPWACWRRHSPLLAKTGESGNRWALAAAVSSRCFPASREGVTKRWRDTRRRRRRSRSVAGHSLRCRGGLRWRPLCTGFRGWYLSQPVQ